MAISDGSNESTSVGLSLSRNCLLSTRMRASETSAMVISRGADFGATRASHAARPGARAARPRPSVTETVIRLFQGGLRGLRRFGAQGLLSGSTVGFVRLHDLLDERVPHDVPFVEVHECDALDVANHLHGL